MKLRLLSIAGLAALTGALAVAGCGSDDDSGGGTSGSAGKSGGAGGKSGGSGTAGKGGGSAGKGGSGTAGSEPMAGSGGEPEGGTGGATAGSNSGGKGGSTAGSGGKGGSGGSTAGSGGKGGSGGSTAGAGGSGGKGGAGGAGGSTAGAGGSTAGAGGSTAGSGGSTAGAGGSTAGAGGSTAGAGGSTAGSGGTGGAAAGSGGAAAGSGGSGPSATGCSKLTAPFATASTSSATVQSGYDLKFGTTANLTAATISSSIYVGAAGSATNLQYYVVSTIGGLSCTAYAPYIGVAGFTSGFAAATLNVSSMLAAPAATPPVTAAIAYCANNTQVPFDGLTVTGIGLSVINGTGTPATTTVWLDSVTITGANPAIAAYPFSTSPTPFTVAGYPTITGAAVAWQATCP